MKVYTDNPNFADQMLSGASWSAGDKSAADAEIGCLIEAIFNDRPFFETDVQVGQRWQHLFVAECSSRSQYDLLIEQRRLGLCIPDGVLCLSGAGSGLRGLRQRPWAAEAGNIHLSVHLTPQRLAVDSGIPFMVLAAVSVLDAIDSVPDLDSTAGIKWVNDILLEDSKVAGVLAYTEGAGKSVDAVVLGIGLNVEKTPYVEGTRFVPNVASLRDFAPDCKQAPVFEALLDSLDRNYRLLLSGRSSELLGRYRDRSIVVGRGVTVYVDDTAAPDQVIAGGVVERVGDNLELYFVGSETPVTRGRLALDSET